MENLQVKIKSQNGVILKELSENPLSWFTIGYFCGTSLDHFIGYKAAARMGELQKKGFLISRWSKNKTVLGARVKEYRFNPEYYAKVDDNFITVKEKPLQLNF